jgi:hypothetical protein
VGARFTAEERAGFVVLALVVAAVIWWQALGPEPRHDGLTRADADRAAAFGEGPGRCGERVRCRAVDGHWRCVALFPGGARFASAPGDEGAPAAVVVFAC